MASSAVTVVWPSAPLPPFSVRPAEVSERWLPGSAMAHCEESNAGPLKLSSSSVRTVSRKAGSLRSKAVVVPSPTKVSVM